MLTLFFLAMANCFVLGLMRITLKVYGGYL